jgi:hypothetical protein
MEELKYGLLGDKLVHINDVERGLACNCLCPHCKGQLIAKKGGKRTKHFAHYKLADCSHGTETALHLLAKSIICQTRKVFVPYIPKTEYDFSQSGRVLTFEKAVPEKQLSDSVRGDAVLYSGGSLLNVEIKVTHEVDANKTIELFNLGIPTIEIDLSDIISNFTPELIEQRILSGVGTHLINSPKSKSVFAKRILGEWKKVYNSDHVNDCPLSRKKAYFIDFHRKGGSCECHECNAFQFLARGDILLCLGCLDSVDFSRIEKILHLEKEENHVCYVKLLMNDGSTIERSSSARKIPR